MKKTLLILFTIVSLFNINLFSQTEKPENPLIFKVTGFESNSGQAILLLYRPNDDVPKKPFKRIMAEIINRESIFSIKDLPYGDYAVIVVHDKNKNGVIDHKWGMPAEPLGYTNNWKLTLFSGMPSFEKLKFHFSKASGAVVIKMKE